MADKLPYQIKLKISSLKPENIGKALDYLRELMSDYDTGGETGATVTIEHTRWAPLESIMDDFEQWRLNNPNIAIEDDGWGMKRPAIRPETLQARLRAAHRTPIDDMLRDTLEERDDA